MKEHNYYVYVLTTKRHSVFYVGVTNDLIRRVYEHKIGIVEGFTKKYHVKKLVYFEHYEDIYDAIQREKLIKKWRRTIKKDAIGRLNPEWRDLYFDLIS